MPYRSIPLLFALLPVLAWGQASRPSPAQSAPLRDDSGVVREQPLSAGRVTGSVDVPVPLGDTPVTVRSVTPSSVVGQYRIHFAALDVDGDGFISREEAQANPALADEFNALDVKRRGKLDRADLAGWLID
ncbi:EF-hand domain-containing protein [Stenotrophomonas sp. 24(2023)]|uniref:EF-hand domain-containing protein n=1 Tax=Stenotrophomonas sp. 24(2023) TaxID=3068324 RepID=UPI0027DFFA08|nr:EF-hand domain-containing protein [Stenotrophomonas sp. 24(2023)]WMJ67896.1 EF-hand domain-containing protein [Stenotrophomonas sp. 24(2023)]